MPLPPSGPIPPLSASGLLLAIGLGGCVTINIYFPEAAAERVADRIIDQVWELPEGSSGSQRQPGQTPAPRPTSAP